MTGRDDPFGLSEDHGRTRVRPLPGARSAGAQASAAAVLAVRRTRAHPNGLVRSFALLLEFAPELENAIPPDDPDALRARLHDNLTVGRDSAVATGVPLARADAAAWMVAALLDDLALNTPWGGSGSWPRQPLVVLLSGDVDAGTRFFDRLEALERTPDRDREMLELAYLCLSLGFRGKYRVPGRSGDRSLAAVRTAVAGLLRAGEGEGEPLSPHWEGVVAADERPRFTVPIWVLPALGVMVAAGIYIALSSRLAVEAETLDALARSIPPADRAEIYRPVKKDPPVVKPLEPAQFNLLPEIQAAVPAGLLPAMKGKENVSLTSVTVSWTNPDLFRPARAKLTEGFEPMFLAIGKTIVANEELIGRVRVVGHTDSSPVQASNPFSNNQKLSEARAETVAGILAAAGVPKERLTVEGRAATEPVADNKTRAGKAANRRIEILIEKRL